MRCVRACVALLAIASAAQWAAAQAVPVSPPPASASAPGMPATIVLPPKIIAGERGTLSVLDADGRLVPAAAVELPGAKLTTDAAGRALFTAPAQPGTVAARLANGATFSSAVVAPSPAQQPVAGAPQTISPRVIALGNQFAIQGPGFRGDATLDHITLSGQPALVLAASSLALTALPNPRTPLGDGQLAVEAPGRAAARSPVAVVALTVQGPGRALAPREKGILTLEVRGTSQRLTLAVRNLSQQIVAFPKGDSAQITTSGGAPNVAKIKLTGVAVGDYSVIAQIVQDSKTNP
jgi:hypothetical protein